jgi:hypothetical protein
MNDEQEISNLIFQLAIYRDQGQWDEAAAMLEHATFESHYPAQYSGVGHSAQEIAARKPGTTGRQRGAAEIADLFRTTARLYEDGKPHTQYVTSNLLIEVEPERTSAVVQSYYVIFQSRPGFPLQPISAGRYVDRFERVDGRWRFSARDAFADHTGDLSHHLSADPVEYGEKFEAQ